MSATTGHPAEPGPDLDVSTLHTLAEELAALFSEVTVGDLQCPTHDAYGDLGDLYLHVLDQNLQVTAALTAGPIPRGEWPDPQDRASLGRSIDNFGGCGLEVGYRQTARLVEGAFASPADGAKRYELTGTLGAVNLTALFEVQVSNTVVHTWDIAEALGFPYRPSPKIAQRVLKAAVLAAADPLGTATAPSGATGEADTFECALRLLGRGPCCT